MNQTEFTDKILRLKKELFELRLKRATKQNFKSHLFKYTRTRLAQLLAVQKK